MRAASDYSALTSSVADFQWSQNFKDPPTIWAVRQILIILLVAAAFTTIVVGIFTFLYTSLAYFFVAL